MPGFVGHVIGLGDRHGSNILVDQLTWGALHIDFGDVSHPPTLLFPPFTPRRKGPDNKLFGVAQDRSFLPEKVPFRLTRMMTNCFELADRKHDKITESRGNFIKSSVVTMEVLRVNSDIILAMLEAFLYDPLLSWTVSRFSMVLGETDG
jgi:FKBP12-rapamycin complex-associated protein